MSRLRSLVKSVVGAVPPLRALWEWNYRRWFATPGAVGTYQGAFPDFASARRACPGGLHAGYDTPAAAAKYADRMVGVEPGDEPVVRLLTEAITSGARRIFDLGGHVGVAFYAWRDLLPHADELSWTVCDVPAVTAAGRTLAEARGAQAQLRFTTDTREATGADVLLAQGSLQYIEAPLAELLQGLAAPPPRVIINRTPLRDGPDRLTLQNIGAAICPYALRNRAAFVASLRRAGYEPTETWSNDRRVHVPLHPELADARYTGYGLVRQPVAGGGER